MTMSSDLSSHVNLSKKALGKGITYYLLVELDVGYVLVMIQYK
jgi:hypothetical protein